jgi:hypothetical protein
MFRTRHRPCKARNAGIKAISIKLRMSVKDTNIIYTGKEGIRHKDRQN